jgi:tryptophan halogenase
LRRLAPGAFSGVTRAVARPHGWIFQIPLRDWTSTGYIFNPTLSTDAEVDADYTAFLQEEGVHEWQSRGGLVFPNFVRKQLFDGRVFRGGNAACFLEPLEATAIGSAIQHARAAAHWMAEHPTPLGAEDDVAHYNEALLTNVCRDSLFLAWHYACGSRWDTPFWRHARQGLGRARANPWAAPQLAAMQPFVAAGRKVPAQTLAQCGSQDEWDQRIFPLLKLFRPYGNFSELNFAQVGHGIGCYGTRPSPAQPRRVRQARVARGP